MVLMCQCRVKYIKTDLNLELFASNFLPWIPNLKTKDLFVYILSGAAYCLFMDMLFPGKSKKYSNHIGWTSSKLHIITQTTMFILP